jgi:hypothetical protein
VTAGLPNPAQKGADKQKCTPKRVQISELLLYKRLIDVELLIIIFDIYIYIKIIKIMYILQLRF